MKITLPEGFEVPQDAKPGEPFESVATIVMNEDGTFDITAIDGVDIDEGANEPAGPEEPEGGMRGQMRGDAVKLPFGEDNP